MSIILQFKFGAEYDNPYKTAEDYPRFRSNMAKYISSRIEHCNGLIPNPDHTYRITLEVVPNANEVQSKKNKRV
jgi:hypothetical protein